MNSPVTTITALLQRYSALLFDAFGVLLDDQGALPGAVALIDRLNAEGRPYCILTNSASRLPGESVQLYAACGLAIPEERILSSGMLLAPYFQAQQLTGATTLVLGPAGSQAFARAAGMELVPPTAGCDAEVVVVADEKGYPLLEQFDHTLSLMLRRLDAGRPLHLVVCNPDLIYPRGPDAFGLTAGGMASLFETILAERYGAEAPRFIRLGKPYAPLFEVALERVGSRDAVMVGDQLATDIRGAHGVGIDSALVASGLARHAPTLAATLRPTWQLPSLLP